MDKTPAPGLAQDNGRVPNDSTSAPSKGKRGRKGSQSIESKRHPLRSANSARVLRSTSKNKSATPNAPVSPLRSAHNSPRVLRSTPENKRKTPKKPVKSLRSAHSSARVRRSTLKKNSKAPNEPVNNNTAVQPTAKKRKRGRPSSAASPKKNDCIKIRQRVRYILNRMNYEQSLIQAYASDGWKGQSTAFHSVTCKPQFLFSWTKIPVESISKASPPTLSLFHLLPAAPERIGALSSARRPDLEAYGKGTSDPSDDEEWSGNSTNPKGNLEDSDSDSLDWSPQPAKTCSRRARGRQQNDEHTSRSEQRTEVLRSNGSSSTGRKRHFGPIVSQKLKAHIEKDPYPSRQTKESLAQELGLTLLQVTKWFASTRHYSRVSASKKGKHPEGRNAENNDRMADDSIQQIEPNGRVLKKQTVDGSDSVLEDRMAQDNLDEGKREGTPFRQDISRELTFVATPIVNQNRTTNLREVGSPNSVPGGNQYSGNSRNAEGTPSRQDVGLNQTVPVTPVVNQKHTPDTGGVGSPGVSGGNQQRGTPRSVGSPRGRSAEKSIPGLDHVDEARRKAILRELRRMKQRR
uniref:Uncharacterized protein n=3 Tax=Avena sativa TaxID=4498 RepID=A0ACD5VJK5_AVESA